MGSPSAREWISGFGFNDVDFSDRVLLLEISTNSGGEEHLHCLPSVDGSESGATDFKIVKFHINFLILASKSPYFQKLFTNGMRESQHTNGVTLRIDQSEESAFMDLLKFMYEYSVNASSLNELVDVLMAADKFEVPSCIRHCVELLLKLPMSTESALVYLDLPPSVLGNAVVQTLVESAKQYLSTRFKDLTESQEEVMSLPLCAVEIILGSDDLEVDSEDVVFDFILKWARLHYTEHGERQDILAKCLTRFICLPHMSNLKLKEAVDCPDFNSEEVTRLVLNALFSKDQDMHSVKYTYPSRIYNHRVVKVVQLQLARPQCVVYFDLTKKECAVLVPTKRLYTQTFCLGGHKFALFAQCTQEQGAIGLYVYAMEGSESCILDFDFSVMKKSSNEFTSLVKAQNTSFQTSKTWGFQDPFETPWKDFMSDESEHFIDEILHLRADITLINYEI